MLHRVYLGLFNYLIDWIQGFLKKHGGLDAFDEVWNALRPYTAFVVPKKAYCQVRQ